MMSQGLNPINGDDSTMPGDYESWPAPAARRAPLPPLGPIVPPPRATFPQSPATGRTPLPPLPPTARIPPAGRPIRSRGFSQRPRAHRRRPRTPNIIIERGHRPHSSWGCDRVITIPLDCRPTLGLRGPPKRYVEIERVRCHRRRRPRYYEYDYDQPPPPPPQQPIMIATPVANSSSVQVQPLTTVPTNNTTPAVTTSNPIANLSTEMINNLPRQTIHLPPIHLPGSHADENTELQTVTFPAEIINPATATLSVIQNNLDAARGIDAPTTVQPHLITIPATTSAAVPSRVVPLSPAMASDPVAQRFRDLFQRLNLSQPQPTSSPTSPPIIHPTLPTMSEFNPTSNTVNNRPNPPTINSINPARYPPANIRPTNPLNTGSYSSPNFVPTAPSNMPDYRSSTFTSSRTATNATYRPTSIAPSNTSDIGPYQRANITPYTSAANAGANYSQGTSSFPSAPTTPSGPRTAFPQLYSSSTNNYENSSSLPFNRMQSINSIPKSILRNAPSNNPTVNAYTNSNSPNVMSSNEPIRKTTRFT